MIKRKINSWVILPFASTVAYISSSITINFPASFTICPCKSPFRVAGQLALADKVVNAVKSGAIRKFVVMAGCDGRMKNRNYYTEFAEQLPDDCVILTAGYAKYRYNKLSLGDINGIPRVLDAGQCNDSYSLALIAINYRMYSGWKECSQSPGRKFRDRHHTNSGKRYRTVHHSIRFSNCFGYPQPNVYFCSCLLYTSDAADD